MFRLLKHLKKREWIFALCAVAFIVAQVWLDLKMPDYMNTITQIAQGGINAETAPIAAKAGADIAVVGSALFNAEDPKALVAAIQAL